MENAERFAGLEVVRWEQGQPLSNPARSAYRIGVEYEAETPWVDLFAAFCASPGADQVQAFLVGPWGDVSTGDTPEAAVEALVGARDRLRSLRALFFGDIAMEESEVSWIHQGDLSPILSAFPVLTVFQVRGSAGLALGTLSHANLEQLIVETGGLDRSVVAQVAGANLPNLQHLELWLGDDGYGANTTPQDLAPIFSGALFPKLRTLALRNCHYADELAKAVALAPIVERLAVLDLSLGTLTDEGAQALLDSPGVRKLSKLDLHHHYLSDAMMERFASLPCEVNLDDRCEADDYGGEQHRYVAVGE